MLKKILIVLVVLLLLAAGAAYWAVSSLDHLVKYAIEHYGPDVAGVPVTVKEVAISASSGSGSLKGLEIGNPPGFKAARAAKLGEIRVALDVATLRDDLVVIHEVAIEAPEIAYEKGDRGTNLEAIQKNIEAFLKAAGGKEGGSASTEPKGKGRRYVIEKFAIRGARVTMTNPGLKGQGLQFTLPDIELRDIGRRPEGVSGAQAASIVTNALVAKIGQRVLGSLELLRKGGAEGAIDALRGLVR